MLMVSRDQKFPIYDVGIDPGSNEVLGQTDYSGSLSILELSGSALGTFGVGAVGSEGALFTKSESNTGARWSSAVEVFSGNTNNMYGMFFPFRSSQPHSLPACWYQTTNGLNITVSNDVNGGAWPVAEEVFEWVDNINSTKARQMGVGIISTPTLGTFVAITTYEIGAPDFSTIVVISKAPGAAVWTPPVVIETFTTTAFLRPQFVMRSNGDLMLFYAMGVGEDTLAYRTLVSPTTNPNIWTPVVASPPTTIAQTFSNASRRATPYRRAWRRPNSHPHHRQCFWDRLRHA